MQSFQASTVNSASLYQNSTTKRASTLNQPPSAPSQPPVSAPPSYSPNQPPSVVQAQVNKRTAEMQEGKAVKAQLSQVPVHVADKNLASSVLTGEYSSKAAQLRGNTAVGSYLSVSV